jgi:hypothetical protein
VVNILSAGNKKISAPPPCGLLIGIYLFYENWSPETFRKKESKKSPAGVKRSETPAGGLILKSGL